MGKNSVSEPMKRTQEGVNRVLQPTKHIIQLQGPPLWQKKRKSFMNNVTTWNLKFWESASGTSNWHFWEHLEVEIIHQSWHKHLKCNKSKLNYPPTCSSSFGWYGNTITPSSSSPSSLNNPNGETYYLSSSNVPKAFEHLFCDFSVSIIWKPSSWKTWTQTWKQFPNWKSAIDSIPLNCN